MVDMLAIGELQKFIEKELYGDCAHESHLSQIILSDTTTAIFFFLKLSAWFDLLFKNK